MEEKNRFQSDILYDLPLHQEFTKLTTQTFGINILIHVVTILCVIFFIPMLRFPYIRWLYFVLFCVIGVPKLLQFFKKNKGDLAWEQTLHRNNGQPPRQQVMLDEESIRSRSLGKDREISDNYDQVRLLMESENLLLVMTKLRMIHIIDKRTLTGGSREELIAFLREKCPKLKNKIKTGRLYCIVEKIMWGFMILGLILSLANSLQIPEKRSNQLANYTPDLTNDTPYEEIADELGKLDIQISEDVMEIVTMGDVYYAPGTPDNFRVYYLLVWEGNGNYFLDGVATDPYIPGTDLDSLVWVPSTSGVYWFDHQVLDRKHIYTNFLAGISAMDEDISFSNISEDYSQTDISQGSGAVFLSFDYLGTHYEFEAHYNYDWFDTDMIYYLGRILAADEDPKNLWCSLNEQGILLYYGTEENKDLLIKKTGIDFYDCVTIRMGH